MLPPDDVKFLSDRAIAHSVTSDGNMTCIVFPAYPLPPGFDRSHSDLLIRLSPGYPDVPPDMWWFDPPIRRADGQGIPATEVIEHYLGRGWQRWSRHLQTGQWRSGVDCLETYLALLRRELERSVPEVVR